MQDFYTKDNYTQADIEHLMSNKIEESLYLEYKAGAALRVNQKQEIAKDVSAFANSDGGVIIYGISETDYYPSEYSFVNGEEVTREWLESIIQGNVKRRIPNLKIFPIRFNKNQRLTIYAVQIPPSNIAPHMTSFGRYYKRHNFQSVPMEEYEVRNLYSRVQSTELRISKLKFKVLHSEKGGKNFKLIDYRLYFQIINISNALEQHYKLEIKLPKEIYNSCKQPFPNPYLVREDVKTCTLSVPGKSPIFQGELTTMLKFSFQLNKNTFENLKNGIQTKLYYSNGLEERLLDPIELLTYNRKSVKHLKFV